MKYIVFKDKIYVPHMQTTDQVYNIPFTNIYLDTTNIDPSQVIIPTVETLDAAIKAAVEANGTEKGTIYVTTVQGISDVITGFNNGLDITFNDGTTFNQADAVFGDRVAFRADPVNATEQVRPETGYVNGNINMELATDNNTQDLRLVAVESQLAVIVNTEIPRIDAELATKVGGVNGAMSLIYNPTSTNQVAIHRDIIRIDAYMAAELIGTSGDGTFDRLTDLKVINTTQNNRLTNIENTLSGGIDIDIADAKLTWSGTVSGTGDATEAIFTLPIAANGLSNNINFAYTALQTIEIGLTDVSNNPNSVSTESITVNNVDEENFYFKDTNIAVTARISTVNQGKLIVTAVSGTKDISTDLKLTKVNQIVTLSAASFAKKDDLTIVETRLQDNINQKQYITDNTLTTTDKTIVGAINELKTSETGHETRIAANEAEVKLLENNKVGYNINTGDRLATIGTLQINMYAEIKRQYDLGLIDVGTKIAVAFTNPTTNQTERTAIAELESFTATEAVVNLKLWEAFTTIDKTDTETRRGKLILGANTAAGAIATEIRVYVFDDMVVGGTIGDFKWSYNSNQSGWAIANGASTAGMDQAVIDVFGANLPDLVTDGKFVRGSSIAGTLQDDATAVNGLGGTTTTAGNHSHTNGAIGGSTWGSSINASYNSYASGRLSYNTGSSGNHTHSLNITGDTETRPTNISMIPLVYVGI